MSSKKYGQERLYLGTIRNDSEKLFIFVYLLICTNIILTSIWMITCTAICPPQKKCRASGVMNQIRMCCEPWPDSTMNPSRAQRSSETILHGAGFLFWLRTHIWFQSQGPNVSCRLKMSTPVWSKNRVYYIKITPHRKFHKSPQKRAQPALQKGIEMWV